MAVEVADVRTEAAHVAARFAVWWLLGSRCGGCSLTFEMLEKPVKRSRSGVFC